MNTTEREKIMEQVKRAGALWVELMEGKATEREIEIRGQYPKMPRERVLRIVAQEMAK
jgi:hypothetical protein